VKTSVNARILLSLFSAIAWPVFAQQPPDVVVSDSYGNTAMGTSVLLNIEPPAGFQNTGGGESALQSNTTGAFNTAFGVDALTANTTGYKNVATGTIALSSNTTGSFNAALGESALTSNTTGSYNTGSGASALESNMTGNYNTGDGTGALYNNTNGSGSVATGYKALFLNSTGSRNNAAGEEALFANTTANDNNAMGTYALHDNDTGTLNNAMGNYALEFNVTGNNNNAVGYGALLRNTTGSDNSAQGYEALGSNTSGNSNIAIGYQAGYAQTTGSGNIYLGNPGVDHESSVTRIGLNQTAAFIAGISGNVQTGGTVVVTASGQLGVASSSRRYKEDIQPMGDVSERLYQLRPVKFRYIKPDEQGHKPVQFGLIAEEVAEVLPEVVYRNTEGKVEGVRYDELAPMLVNEIKQLHEQIAAQASQLRKVDEIKRQLMEMREQNRAMQVALAELQAKDNRVAMP
jgi:hypothetical protein